jgi:luciferase family oxidoreductase group 1
VSRILLSNYQIFSYLHDTAEAGSIKERIKAIPQIDTVPMQWLLSSSGQSGLFAAHFGMGFSFAHFINPTGGPEAVRMYRERFQPSEDLKKEEANVAAFIFCSENEEKIFQHEALMDFRFLQLEKGLGLSPASYEDIKDVYYSPAELERISFNRKRVLTGTPSELKQKLDLLLNTYNVDELIAVTITEEFEDRIQSYELLAQLFGIKFLS